MVTVHKGVPLRALGSYACETFWGMVSGQVDPRLLVNLPTGLENDGDVSLARLVTPTVRA